MCLSYSKFIRIQKRLIPFFQICAAAKVLLRHGHDEFPYFKGSWRVWITQRGKDTHRAIQHEARVTHRPDSPEVLEVLLPDEPLAEEVDVDAQNADSLDEPAPGEPRLMLEGGGGERHKAH